MDVLILNRYYYYYYYYLCIVTYFLLNRPNYGATLSLRAYRRPAQDAEVKVVFL